MKAGSWIYATTRWQWAALVVVLDIACFINEVTRGDAVNSVLWALNALVFGVVVVFRFRRRDEIGQSIADYRRIDKARRTRARKIP